MLWEMSHWFCTHGRVSSYHHCCVHAKIFHPQQELCLTALTLKMSCVVYTACTIHQNCNIRKCPLSSRLSWTGVKQQVTTSFTTPLLLMSQFSSLFFFFPSNTLMKQVLNMRKLSEKCSPNEIFFPVTFSQYLLTIKFNQVIKKRWQTLHLAWFIFIFSFELFP